MQTEINLSINKLNDAVNRLREGCENVKDDLDKDGVIQRFEFTFELLWKCLKVILEDKGIICRSPKDCLKEAFKYELINDEEIFLDMLNDRNKTSHLYDKDEADKIYQRVNNVYLTYIVNTAQEITDKHYID